MSITRKDLKAAGFESAVFSSQNGTTLAVACLRQDILTRQWVGGVRVTAQETPGGMPLEQAKELAEALNLAIAVVENQYLSGIKAF